MIQTMSIFQGIEAVLKKKFPAWEIYLEQVPQERKEPAFLIQMQHRQVVDSSKNTVMATIHFLLTGYEKEQTPPEQRLQHATDALDCFGSGKLAVGDRKINISASFTTKDMEVAFKDDGDNYRKRPVTNEGEDVFLLDLKLYYCDDRGEEQGEQPLMEEVISNQIITM
ncbi:MAG: hypothetical protein KHZ62_00680 [Clostridiales bacterium]|nr:hypothetical protein [Clostridiales bacterium]